MNGQDLRTDSPEWVHRLGLALRFVDIFTNAAVTLPLRVFVPAQEWEAIRCASDATYRFAFTHHPVPAGTFDAEVVAPGGEYINYEPIQITLPVAPGVPPPPVRRQDYLYNHPLWPTRQVRLPPGETGILGRIVRPPGQSPANLEVRVYEVGGAPPATPYTRTDGQGEFLFRLPWVRQEMSLGAVNPPPDLAIEIRDDTGPIGPANPVNFTPEPGRAQVLTFQVP